MIQPGPSAKQFALRLWPHAVKAAQAAGQSSQEAARCVAQAVVLSGGGRYCMWNNPWGLCGRGRDGWVVASQALPDPGKVGGCRIVSVELAKFAGPEEACRAWFSAQR